MDFDWCQLHTCCSVGICRRNQHQYMGHLMLCLALCQGLSISCRYFYHPHYKMTMWGFQRLRSLPKLYWESQEWSPGSLSPKPTLRKPSCFPTLLSLKEEPWHLLFYSVSWRALDSFSLLSPSFLLFRFTLTALPAIPGEDRVSKELRLKSSSWQKLRAR